MSPSASSGMWLVRVLACSGRRRVVGLLLFRRRILLPPRLFLGLLERAFRPPFPAVALPRPPAGLRLVEGLALALAAGRLFGFALTAPAGVSLRTTRMRLLDRGRFIQCNR